MSRAVSVKYKWSEQSLVSVDKPPSYSHALHALCSVP